MSLIDQIRESPRLVQYVEMINRVIEAERHAREQFYRTEFNTKVVEFINGQIVAQPPVCLGHADASSNLAMLFGVYVIRHQLGRVSSGTLMICLSRNDYMPDICFWRKEISDSFVKGQMKFPAPDLAVEVLSPSTEDRDRGVKFEDLAAHGVREYWIVDPDARTIEQYRLEGDVYKLVVKVQQGIIRSEVVKGFEIPVQVAFDSSLYQKTLKNILAHST